ncbi:hypothetical protein BGX27_001685, partial [Mortierella sp. AM989]
SVPIAVTAAAPASSPTEVPVPPLTVSPAEAPAEEPLEAVSKTPAKEDPSKKGSKRNIIFVGKSGTGKFTLCSMLLQGDLLSENIRQVSNGATSEDENKFHIDSREDWIVCDTPGLGELHEGAMDVAIEPIVQGMKESQIAYHHIAYVVKQGRLCAEEQGELFRIFKEMFKGSENNFILVITHCDDNEWIREN